jgi:exosortase
VSTQLSTSGPTSIVTTDEETIEPAPASTSNLAVIVVGSILLAAHVPMLFRLAKDLWSREHYQFFPFLIPVSAFLIWEGLQRLRGPVQAGNQIICYALILISGAMLVVSSLIGSGTLAALAALLTMATIIYGIGSWTLFKECFAGWVVLFLAVPPPFRLDDRLITTLQRWVAYANGQILDVLGVEHIIQGATVLIPGRNLLVEEACSGIHSLFSSLFCALGLALWMRRGVIHTLVLLAITVYWVLLGNLLRVLLIVLADIRLNYDLAHDPEHSTLSIIIFIGILGLLFSTDRLLLFFNPRSRAGFEATTQRGKAWTNSILELLPDINASWVSSWAIGILFALIAAFQFYIMGGEFTRSVIRPDIKFTQIGADGLRKTILGSQQMAFDTADRPEGHINGEHSQIWKYAFNNQHICEVSLDYTFTGWHELNICYTNNGWEILSRTTEGTPEGEIVKDPFVKVEMIMPHTGRRGFLVYCLFDEKGERIEPPSRTGKLWRERLDNIWQKILGKDINRMTVPTYQVQLFIPTYAELTPTEKEMAIQFFREIEKEMQIHVQKITPSTPGEESPGEGAPLDESTVEEATS